MFNQLLLRLYTIEEGCLVVTFLIPTVIANEIMLKFKTQQREVLRVMSVLWLECKEWKMDFQEDNAYGKNMFLLLHHFVL